MGLIDVRNANKAYRSSSETNQALCNLNITVQEGTIYGILGPSGCGKTTLISCIVGVNQLDSGNISIFGQSFDELQKHRIGYMPQENALITGCTSKEMIWFFGTIYGMSSERIKQRFDFLKELLHLPDENNLIKECSGGEQRRISFALTLVHEPELLILDEPTVGVDPLLRSNIWEYLLEITQTKNVTVLMSTHYIEEATQCTCVGIMRNGTQIVEDSPRNILRQCQAKTLEEAFLTLSQKQESETLIQNDVKYVEMNAAASAPSALHSSSRDNQESSNFLKPSDWKIIVAIFMRNMLQSIRSKETLIIAAVFPIISFIAIQYGVGGNIKGMKLGMVNGEVSSFEQCFDRSLNVTEIIGYDCKLNKASCKFVQILNAKESYIKLKPYENFEDAYEDVKNSKLLGFIQFSSNFTNSLPLFNDKVETDFTDDGVLQIYLDDSDMQKSTAIRKRIYDTYEVFMEELMVGCGKSKKAGNSPIHFESAHGVLNFNFATTMTPGVILTANFALSSVISSVGITMQRVDGTWDRTITAGAKPYQFLVAQLMEGLLFATVQFIESYACALIFLTVNLNWISLIVLMLLLLLTIIAGQTFGLMTSIVATSVRASYMCTTFGTFPLLIISGSVWPIEALPNVIQYISKLFPFANPVIAYRNVLGKNSIVCDSTVLWSIATLIIWIVGQLSISFWCLREKNTKQKMLDAESKRVNSKKHDAE